MRELSMLIKPASASCGMRCRYCFYADVSANRKTASFGRMSEETLSSLLLRAAESGASRLSVSFQGGEPTLAGLDFFTHFVKEAARRLPGVAISYSIQTGGIGLDEAWVAFFKAHGFLVGLSIDGWQENHDFLRPDATGRGTYRRVRQAEARLRAAGVSYNILTVVTKQVADKADKLFREIVKNNWSFVQLIPCLAPLYGEEPQTYTLTPERYGAFLCEMFSLYVKALESDHPVSIRFFDNLLLLLQQRPAEQCGMRGRCSPQFVVEADGGVYPCDFYVLDEWRCGNVNDDTFDTLWHHPAMRRFLSDCAPDPRCHDCPYLSFCGGACKRFRPLYLQTEGYCPYRHLLKTIAATGLDRN